MQCLQCEKEAQPANALCEECFAAAGGRRRGFAAGETNLSKPAPTAGQGKVAPHVLRLISYLCDCSLISFFYLAIYKIGIFLAQIDTKAIERAYAAKDVVQITRLADQIQLMTLISALSYIVPAWFYFVLFECSKFQATPGKTLVGLVVVEGGDQLNIDTATKRFLLKFSTAICPLVLIPALGSGCFVGLLFPLILIVLLATFLFALINPFFVFFTARRQALHDLILGTQVVHDRELGVGGVLFCLVLAFGAFVLQIVFSILI